MTARPPSPGLLLAGEWERSSAAGRRRPGEGEPSPESAPPSPCPSPTRERGRAQASRQSPDRFASAPRAFALLVTHASRRERITYADFADQLGLGSPRALGWLLTPLLQWCQAADLPPLPIIVVRRADGLPSGGYDPESVAAETARVFDHDWAAVEPPAAAELNRYALPRLPAALRDAAPHVGA